MNLNGRLVPSYFVNGTMLILLRDLENYGFDVRFDEASKTAYADYNPNKSVDRDAEKTVLENPYIIYTDIRAVVNGAEIETHNTNGYIAVEAERLGNYAPHISCVWQPQHRRLEMCADNDMAHIEDLVNAISERKGIPLTDGCSSFADTNNGRYDEFVSRGYISKIDYNGYIGPMSGLRMKDFVLIAGRVYAGVGLDKVGHGSHGAGKKDVFRYSDVPNYLSQYALFMNELGILIPDEHGIVYLDGTISIEQMEYYLDVLDAAVL